MNPVLRQTPQAYKLPHVPQKGETVYLCSLGKEAMVLSVSEKANSITVQCGAMRMRTKLTDVMLAADAPVSAKPPQKTVSKHTSTSVSAARDAHMELDLRGETGEDGWFRTDKFLDEAVLAGLHSVVLIHGKGTGALRRALWEYLKKDQRVQSFRAGQYGEGDTGVTVVELK